LQVANLYRAQLQGSELREAQLHGATLAGAQLQGVDLRSASLWSIVTNRQTDMSLADLRGIRFDEMTETARAGLLSGFPEPVRARIEELLKPTAGAKTIPPVATPLGPMLIDEVSQAAFVNLDAGQTTTDVSAYDKKLTAYLADDATISSQNALWIASRALNTLSDEPQRLLGRALACRLLAQVATGSVKLPQPTIHSLEQGASPCESLSH
jgi:hypothetical protein